MTSSNGGPRTSTFQIWGSDKQSGQQRSMRESARRYERADEIIKLLPQDPEVYRQFQGVSNESNLRCHPTIRFTVINREAVLALLQRLPPLELVKVVLSRGREIWPSVLRNVQTEGIMQTTTVLAPFIYKVSQGVEFGPTHTVQWVTRLGNIYVAVDVEIAGDTAGFVCEEALHGGHKHLRWCSNGAIPMGQWFGLWDRWQPVEEAEHAHVTSTWHLNRMDPHIVEQGWERMYNHVMIPFKEGHDGNR